MSEFGKSNKPQHGPWIPSGVTGTTSIDRTQSSSASISSSRTHNYVAQSRAERRESIVRDMGSFQTTVFDAKPVASPHPQFGGIMNEDGKPKLQVRARVYATLDSPGMDRPENDSRMTREAIGQQYRGSYTDQQARKQLPDLIPATFSVATSLEVTKRIEAGSQPQHKPGGGTWTALEKQSRKTQDQQSDAHKYRSSHGLVPQSFNDVMSYSVPGSERLAVASPSQRAELSRHFGPGVVVHPSELHTRATEMEKVKNERAAASKGFSLLANAGRRSLE